MGKKTYIRHIVDVLRSARITDIVIIDEAEKNKTVIFSPLLVYAHLSDVVEARKMLKHPK